MKYYKIVSTNSEGKFFSLSPPHRCHLEYKIGEWTVPIIPNSKIFIFNSLHDAQNYNESNFPIFEVYAEGIHPLQYRVSTVFNVGDVTLFWSKPIREYAYFETPKGTIGADRVKLIKRVNL